MKVSKKKPLQVYMIAEEHDFVKRMAEKLGVARSDYIRSLINAAKKKEK